MSTSPTTKEPSQDQLREAFRQHLRQADKFIIEHRFDAARIQLAEAKKLFPDNSFIAAFQERIEVFEHKAGTDSRSSHTANNRTTRSTVEPSPVPQIPLTRDTIEQQLREEIEAEYKVRFTQELRKAEELAAKILLEEKAKLKHQQETLQKKSDRESEEIRQRLEREYASKVETEIATAEKRAEAQFRERLTVAEGELTARLTELHAIEQRELSAKMEREREALLEHERSALHERELMMKEQFNHQLLEALRKNETLFHEQSQQQQQLENDRLKKQLSDQFQAELAKDRESMQQQMVQMRATLEESHRREQEQQKVTSSKLHQEQLDQIRCHEAEKFERLRTALRGELEKEYQEKLERRIAEEREKIQQDIDIAVSKEKERLEKEFNEILQMQNENLQKVRSDLRGEMEQEFLKRLERISEEYNQKMDLLGVKIPESSDERRALYKNKMRACYAPGQPSVDDAKMLMRLKELLDLTFDDHLTIESDVRLELYAELVEKKIVAGELDLHSMDALESLKQQFRITAEEASRLEPYILSSFQRFSAKGKILVVDDDHLLLQSVEHMLTDCGYQVVTALDIKSAMEKLATTPIDTILSDIKFHNDLDGFKFFKSVQEQPRLRKIPFLFMSSIQDGVIMQSGVQLGVDDYVTKPIDGDLLIATIEGKLKRYRTLNKE